MFEIGHLGHRVHADSRLDLDGHHPAVHVNQKIDLAATRPEIRGDEPGAAAAQEGEGDGLAFGA